MTVKELKEEIKDIPDEYTVHTNFPQSYECSDVVSVMRYDEVELDNVLADKDKVYLYFS